MSARKIAAWKINNKILRSFIFAIFDSFRLLRRNPRTEWCLWHLCRPRPLDWIPLLRKLLQPFPHHHSLRLRSCGGYPIQQPRRRGCHPEGGDEGDYWGDCEYQRVGAAAGDNWISEYDRVDYQEGGRVEVEVERGNSGSRGGALYGRTYYLFFVVPC